MIPSKWGEIDGAIGVMRRMSEERLRIDSNVLNVLDDLNLLLDDIREEVNTLSERD